MSEPLTSRDSSHLEQEVTAAQTSANRLRQQLESLEARSSSKRVLVQDYRPLHATIENTLSRRYWAEAGVMPFIEDQVPFSINNDGTLSMKAAKILFAHCLETKPDASISILEIGAGLGLHARYLLDEFQRLCMEEERDFYDRLTFFVTDGSPSTVRDWQQFRIFQQHGQHAVLAVMDASDLGTAVDLNGDAISLPPLHAIFANYILDILPTTVVRRVQDAWEELQVRTWLDRTIVQESDQDLHASLSSPEMLAPEQQKRIAEWMNSFEFETSFIPLELPPRFSEYVPESQVSPVLIQFGAFDCLYMCLKQLAPNGFFLMNDYSLPAEQPAESVPGSDRFGLTLAYGINFPLLEKVVTANGWQVLAPADEEGVPIYTRLFSADRFEKTADVFEASFNAESYRQSAKAILQARRDLQVGAASAALASYASVLRKRPLDWQLIGEFAELLASTFGDYAASLEFAQSAIAINPWFSPSLWNIVGDAYFGLGQNAEAHEAFKEALKLSPRDPRTHFNLSFTYVGMGKQDEALRSLASSLYFDRRGVYRERIISKQAEILDALAREQARSAAVAVRRNHLLNGLRTL